MSPLSRCLGVRWACCRLSCCGLDGGGCCFHRSLSVTHRRSKWFARVGCKIDQRWGPLKGHNRFNQLGPGSRTNGRFALPVDRALLRWWGSHIGVERRHGWPRRGVLYSPPRLTTGIQWIRWIPVDSTRLHYSNYLKDYKYIRWIQWISGGLWWTSGGFLVDLVDMWWIVVDFWICDRL